MAHADKQSVSTFISLLQLLITSLLYIPETESKGFWLIASRLCYSLSSVTAWVSFTSATIVCSLARIALQVSSFLFFDLLFFGGLGYDATLKHNCQRSGHKIAEAPGCRYLEDGLDADTCVLLAYIVIIQADENVAC